MPRKKKPKRLKPAPRDKGGRPTKLTPELQERICALLRQGNYLEVAAQSQGISRECLRHWMTEGVRGDRRYREFSVAVQKAMAEAEAIGINFIAKAAADGNWQAAAWRLERRAPKRWGRQDKVESVVTHVVEDRRSAVAAILIDPALAVAAEAIAARIAASKLLPTVDVDGNQGETVS